MKNLMRNRIVLGMACIILSLVICFGLTPMFNSALESTVSIVRVSADIPKGEQITENMVSIVKVGGYNLPPGVAARMEDVVGRYACADLYKGDYILTDKLSKTPLLRNEYLNKLNGENRAVSVSIKTFAAGLSGKLEAGDIISLVASDVGEMRETVIPPQLQYVEVIAVTASSGMDNDAQADKGEDKELPSTLTVLVTPEQARLLVELEQTGKLHAALVFRGDSDRAAVFLAQQEKVLEELKASEEESMEQDSTPESGGMEEQGEEF